MDSAGNQLIMLGILWLNFLLFHESSEVRKDVSVNGRVRVWTVKRKHEGYIDEGKKRVWHLRQKCMRAGVFEAFLLFRDHIECFVLLLQQG